MIDLRQGDCLEVMKDIPDESIDLVVTSPPYDNLRTYNGNIEQWNFEKFKDIAKELYRTTKNGGVVVWVVGDATIKGSETATSFKQALFFKECGFNLHDTMIFAKNNPMPNAQQKRYSQGFEYMFVLSKGIPKTFNPIMEQCKYAGQYTFGNPSKWNVEGDLTTKGKRKISELKKKTNIFYYTVGSLVSAKVKHPAVFPEQLARDHILSWSNEQDLVLDLFMGSGTTGVACKELNRNFIGIELDENYYKIACERINNTQEKASKEVE